MKMNEIIVESYRDENEIKKAVEQAYDESLYKFNKAAVFNKAKQINNTRFAQEHGVSKIVATAIRDVMGNSGTYHNEPKDKEREPRPHIGAPKAKDSKKPEFAKVGGSKKKASDIDVSGNLKKYVTDPFKKTVTDPFKRGAGIADKYVTGIKKK